MAAAFHFEAKKYALRQAKDGVIVSFVVHPNDVVADLLSAPIGEHYIVALAPYTEQGPSSSTGRAPVSKTEDAGSSPATGAKPPKERRPFHSLPRATQATLLCQDERFRHWLDADPADDGTEALVKFKARMGIASRTELDKPGIAERFDAMVKQYGDWRRDQELPEVRG